MTLVKGQYNCGNTLLVISIDQLSEENDVVRSLVVDELK